MRTTVDIDKKLLEKLRHEAVRQRVSFRELLNTVIRRGLEIPRAPEFRYQVPSFNLGAVREGINIDKANALASALDSDEVMRKLDQRK